MAKRLEKLTDEQRAILPVMRNRWLEIGLSTEPANRSAAEAGISLAYEKAGLKPPRRIIWLRSPYAGMLGAVLLRSAHRNKRSEVGSEVGFEVRSEVLSEVLSEVESEVGSEVRSEVGFEVRSEVWSEVGFEVGSEVESEVWSEVESEVWSEVGSEVGSEVLSEVESEVGSEVRSEVGFEVRSEVESEVESEVRKHGLAYPIYGQHNAGWLSYYATFKELGLGDITAKMDGLFAVAKNAGWWWPFENVCIATERPCVLRRDDENRLHSYDKGAAILYPDGWGFYAWHGLRVPRKLIDGDFTPQEIMAEDNTEIRRAMLEIAAEKFGPDWLIQGLGAKPKAIDNAVHEWSIGMPENTTATLWDCGNIDDDPRGNCTMVEVVNGTPNPDGSPKKYMLRVNPTMQTPREAVAAINHPTVFDPTREQVIEVFGEGAERYVEVGRT